MIRKTVYFRTQEDIDKFNAITNKAQWLHEHLNDPYIYYKGMKMTADPNMKDGEILMYDPSNITIESTPECNAQIVNGICPECERRNHAPR